MVAIGGSIESVTISGRRFSVASDADSNRKLGGHESEIQSNGDGSIRKIKTRVAWMIDGLTLSVDDFMGDHEFLQQISDRNTLVPVTITYASGLAYQGTGTITGELQYSSQNSTASVTLGGSGTLTKQ